MAQEKGIPAHEYATIFALHEGQPLWELSDRIKANGLRRPIVLFDGKILDGRRRELACIRAGVKPVYRKFGSLKTDGDDPLEFVMDENLHLRHLGEAERILAAAKYAQARAGNPRFSKKPSPNIGENGDLQSSQVATIGPTNAEAAEKFGVPEAAVDRAKKVLENGTAKLQKAVEAGTVTVSDAAKIADEPAKVQNAAVAAVEAGEARSAAGAVKAMREPGEDIEPEALTDAEGHEVTAFAFDAFANLEKFKALDSLVRQLQSGIDDLSKLPGGEQLRRFLKPTGKEGEAINKSEHLNALRRDLKGTRPHSVCPWCKGNGDDGCKGCNGAGWVVSTTWKDAEDKIKARLK